MNKYDVWFCHCGTIQLMPNEYYDWLQEDYANRFIIRICQQCGKAQRVWLSTYNDGFAVNACKVENIELNGNDMANCRVLMYKGTRVPMKNGDYATSHFNTFWFDDQGNREVDTERLIREVKDEEKLRSISGYITGIDWKGTPYDYNLLLKGTDEE